MTTAKQPTNGWTKRIMDAIPVAILMLVSWICFSIIQLKGSMIEVQKDITALLAAKNVADTSTIESNSRRLKELEGVEPEKGEVPIVAAPVTVVNPPDKPVPVEAAKPKP